MVSFNSSCSSTSSARADLPPSLNAAPSAVGSIASDSFKTAQSEINRLTQKKIRLDEKSKKLNGKIQQLTQTLKMERKRERSEQSYSPSLSNSLLTPPYPIRRRILDPNPAATVETVGLPQEKSFPTLSELYDMTFDKLDDLYEKHKETAPEFATQCFEIAAYRGYAKAQDIIGEYFLNGTHGFVQSDRDAVSMFFQAAQRGYANSEYRLGCFQRNGLLGFDKCDINAGHYFQRAAMQGHPSAQCAIGFLHITGRGRFEKSSKLALPWIQKSAEQEVSEAQFLLGCFYVNGLEYVLEQSDEKAIEWIVKSADKNYSAAQYFLGIFYRDGRLNLPQDLVIAKQWFTKAAEQGHKKAQAELQKI